MPPKPRVPQTASNRRRQSKRLTKDVPSTSIIPYIQEVASSSPNVEVEPQEEDEREEVEVEADSDIDEGSMKGPFPGGPETNELLIDYRHHVAHRIWNGKERSVLRCRQPVTQLDSWILDDESIEFMNRIRGSGLIPLVQWSFKTVNCHLISAMVERWHPETNTFHLPFGEMGISLDDVDQIIGIPVMGRAVSKPVIIKTEEVVKLVHRALHLNPTDIAAELETFNGRSVRLSWLKDHLAKKTSSMPTHSIECAVRGYLLYLLGCTIFADKTGTYVSVEYLQYLEDLDKVKEYAWGAATLVHLYRQLGMASRAKCKSISGYLTLIQAWVYEHFPLLRPGDDIHVHRELPRMALWKDCRNHPGLQKNNIVLIREMLDSLEAEQIDFNPYLPTRDRFPLQDFAFFKGCLVANRISEPYMPDRYLRQLGHVQSIPGGPIQPIGKARRSRLASSYRVTYGSNVTQMEQWEDVLLGPRTRGHQIIKPWDTVSNYMGWFRRVSHPSISKPESRKYFRYSGNLGSTTPQEDWRTHISQYLQPLAQGRHSANVWQRHVQNVLDYCQDNVPLPSSSGPPKSPTRDRRSRRLNDA